MNEKEFRQLRGFVRKHLQRRFHANHLDDCVQFVALRYTKNPKANWRLLIIDYLRESGVAINKVYKKAGVLAKALELPTSLGTAEAEDPFILEHLKLEERERAMIVLHYVWGFDFEEIAYVFGCTGSNISQHFKALLNKLRKRIK